MSLQEEISSEEELFVNLSCNEDSDSDLESNQSSVENINTEGNVGIIPYNFEPYLSDNGSDDERSSNLSGEEELPQQGIAQDIQRLQNTEW